jgi:chromosome segregation protein
MSPSRLNKSMDPTSGEVRQSSITMGAIWRRIDLHLHSPGVSSFSLPPGLNTKSETDRLTLVESYVKQLRDQQISVCAITDYNGIRDDWFLPIRAEAQKWNIKVLPGAEVSFRTPKYGLHILTVFPEDTVSAEVNSFLQALDRDPSKPLLLPDGKHRDIELMNTSEQGALQRLRDRFRCLIIPPHPDGSNGLCQSFRPGDAAAFLADTKPDALEHCPESQLRKLKNESSLGDQFFSNLALVEFSDPHSIQEIGTKHRPDGTLRATFLRLSSTDIDALRLAFHDPKTRLAVGSPPLSTHPRIRSMEVRGSGFLGNLQIAWNDNLSVIIGGRGAGKSAVLEGLRYALGLESYSELTYRRDLVHYALGSGGKITLILDRPLGDGAIRTYRVVRVWGEEPQVFQLDPERPLAIRPSDLFGPNGAPTIFGQREIYAVSGSEEYRLRLLDDLIGEDARQQSARVLEAVEALNANASSILDCHTRLLKREELGQRLKTLSFEISVFEKHGVTDKLRSATALRSDGQLLQAASKAVDQARSNSLRALEQAIQPLSSAARTLARGQSSNKQILDEAASAIGKLEGELRSFFEQIERLFAQVSGAFGTFEGKWREALKPLEDELNRVKQEVKAESLDPDRLIGLAGERATITSHLDEMAQAGTELLDLQTDRARLLATVKGRRLEEHQLRRERAEAIARSLGDRLKLTVEFKGQKEEYRKQLLALLKGSGVSADAVERLASPDATDGIALAESVRVSPAHVQERFGLTPAMGERLVRWFAEDDSRLFELETLIPPDSLRVELFVDQKARPLERLSPGQRATAILLLLFALEGRILILDQPEDDLDNRFVYQDVVQILREQKGLSVPPRQRQIIAATHNPNIPVIGDAELVLVLDSGEGRTQVTGRASIDDANIRELIKAIMEGGEEAFQRRADKYGGL